MSHIHSGFPQKNECGFEYWLACFLAGYKTILEPIINDENNEFMTGSMVVKGEYLV